MKLESGQRKAVEMVTSLEERLREL